MNFKFPNEWASSYKTQIERNIGLVSIQDQIKIKNTKIAVLGLGGIGSLVAMQLAQIGCENLILADKDLVERSNLNRQLFSEIDIGKKKNTIISDKIHQVNPNIQIKTFENVTPENVSKILQDIQLIVLSLDDPLASISIARYARKIQIPLIETWAIPFLYAWWITPESQDYETVYDLPTHSLSIEEIAQNESLLEAISKKIIQKLLQFPHLQQYYSQESYTIEKMLRNEISLRSFAPIVWLNASYLTFELVYSGILTHQKKILAPKIIAYDLFRRQTYQQL